MNMVEKKGKKVYVRGHWVEFSREEINRLFNLRVDECLKYSGYTRVCLPFLALFYI